MPAAEQVPTGFAFSVPTKGKLKGFVWVWMERIDPKKPRVANPGVLAVRVANLAQRDLMLAAEPMKFFTEPHYAGFPAVLVRLDAVSVADLKVLIAEAWRCMAPADLQARPKGKAATGAKKTVKRTARRRRPRGSAS
ncbi:MAG: hypothetical protein M3081_03385 [Gemmatimonadota bacterium]|nr:hypothetical protein [Gemmatimonadota bacterium]